MQDQTKLPEAFKVRNEPSETISVSARSHREGRVKKRKSTQALRCEGYGGCGCVVRVGWGGLMSTVGDPSAQELLPCIR